jgi:hypothetical protein
VTAEFDHGQSALAVGRPPLPRQVIGLVPPDPQQGGGFLDGQQVGQALSRQSVNT